MANFSVILVNFVLTVFFPVFFFGRERRESERERDSDRKTLLR